MLLSNDTINIDCFTVFSQFVTDIMRKKISVLSRLLAIVITFTVVPILSTGNDQRDSTEFQLNFGSYIFFAGIAEFCSIAER